MNERDRLAEKLKGQPKWVQALFKSVEQERDAAVRALDKFEDGQTKSPFFVESWICDGKRIAEGHAGPTTRKHFIQTNAIDVEHAGVHLRVLLRGDSIEISYEGENRAVEDIVMQPKSFQMLSIFRHGASKQR